MSKKQIRNAEATASTTPTMMKRIKMARKAIKNNPTQDPRQMIQSLPFGAQIELINSDSSIYKELPQSVKNEIKKRKARIKTLKAAGKITAAAGLLTVTAVAAVKAYQAIQKKKKKKQNKK